MADLLSLPSLYPAAAGAGALLLYLVSLAIYRLYLSPIAKFPGPKLAALSLWYEFYYDVVRGGQYGRKIAELHEEYGPIVRINPYELHIKDPEYYDVLYSGPGTRRDKWRWQASLFGNSLSMFGTVPHDLHRLRRGALNPFFSKQAVARLEPVIREMIDKVSARFEKCRESGEPVETGQAYAALTTDIITRYAFGTSYGCIEDPNWKWEWPKVMNDSTKSCHLNKQFKFVFPAMQATPEWIIKRFDPAVMNIINFQKDLEKQIITVRDSKTAPDASGQKTLFQELLNGSLPPEEKELKRLVDEGQTMIAAGQQTTAHHLKTVTYHVVANPEIHRRLRAELESAIPNTSSIPPLAQLEKLPYLRAVILEGHRFSHGVVSRLPRISPDQPLQFKEWVIPAGTPVSMTSVIQHADPTRFPEPERYNPDRWLNAPERLEKYIVSFSKGTRQCLGINLANAELYLTLATVFRRFKMELYETTARDAEIAHDFFIPHGPRRLERCEGYLQVASMTSTRMLQAWAEVARRVVNAIKHPDASVLSAKEECLLHLNACGCT